MSVFFESDGSNKHGVFFLKSLHLGWCLCVVTGCKRCFPAAGAGSVQQEVLPGGIQLWYPALVGGDGSVCAELPSCSACSIPSGCKLEVPLTYS